MNKKIGARLKKLRKSHNYSQSQVAKYLQINQGQLSKIENGTRTLNLSLLDKISLLYNCSHEYILLKSNDYSSNEFSFRCNENNVDLNIIAKMNQIMGNLKFLRKL